LYLNRLDAFSYVYIIGVIMDMRGPFEVGADPIKVRQRIMGQGMRILNALVEAYNDGILDDNKQSAHLCTMFALVAEGKVVGTFDEETGLTKWALKEDYQKKLEEVREAILSTKIVKGPWEKSVDKDLN
tara:strand:+ start:1279 stop:1665 length:387 start_codon:yes stop_codon:yes gene_type:complete